MKNVISFIALFTIVQITIADSIKDLISDIIRIDYEGATVDITPKLQVLPLMGTSYKIMTQENRESSCLQLNGNNSQLISISNTKGDLVRQRRGVLLSMWVRGTLASDSCDVNLLLQSVDQSEAKQSEALATSRLSGKKWIWLAVWYYRKQNSASPKAFILEISKKTKVIIGDVLMTYAPEKFPNIDRPVLRVDENKIIDRDEQIVLKGINLSAYSSEVKHGYNHELTATREDDYRRIAHAGFNVVRLNLWYQALMEEGGWEWLNIHRLWAYRHGLRLILDLHAPPGGYQSPVYSGDFWKNTEEAIKWRAQTLRFWQDAAGKFTNDPIIAAFDLLNEPKPEHDAQWWNFVRKAVALIRAEGFTQPIIVESSFAQDSGYELLDDKGIIYDYHFYDPWLFASGQSGKYHTACIPDEKGTVLNKDWLMKDLKINVLNFVRDHKVPLNIGEYGISHKAMKLGGGQWLQDLTDILDEYNISRQYWCWHTYLDFSIERSGWNRQDPTEINEQVLSIISDKKKHIEHVAKAKGLVAFWDFEMKKKEIWVSYYDNDVVNRSFPVYLKHIGDTTLYTSENWNYDDKESRLLIDKSGPFGHAIRFNKGYIFGEVPRYSFDDTPLNIHGKKPFTIIVWVKFIGHRHMIAGIWDEGGWNKYSGRRQVALFSGLFDAQSVIAHISATGAASFPQSEFDGAQFARQRAIDGKSFNNGNWVAMAMTFDSSKKEVSAYLNGIMTTRNQSDPVANDVFRFEDEILSNPFHFKWPVYSPRSFILKYNGYNVETTDVYEHWLEIDLNQNRIVYDIDYRGNTKPNSRYRIIFDVRRLGTSLLLQPLKFKATKGKNVTIPIDNKIQPLDVIITSLEERKAGKWIQVGTEVRYTVTDGAPFTFGRALGLGSEILEDGSQLFIDGVAVFNRVLSSVELRMLSFKY